MDRRHLVLAIACVASISTQSFESPRPTVYLFEGFEELEGGPVTLDAAQPERAWRITAELVLPPEAEHSDFESELAALVSLVDPEAEHSPVTYGLDDCAGEAIAVASTEWEPHLRPGADDVFVDCLPKTPCIVSVCLRIAKGNEETPVEVQWTTWAYVHSDVTLEPEASSNSIPIEITVEEIEP